MKDTRQLPERKFESRSSDAAAEEERYGRQQRHHRQTIFAQFPLMLKQNDEWAVSRRYMTLETIGSLSHNPTVSLPALAA